MSELDRSIEVTITKEEATVTQEGFGELLVLGVHKYWNDRVRTYTSTQEMIDDGFKTTDAEYIAANNYFSQNPHPEKIYIGRRSVDEITIEVTTVENNTEYTVDINSMTTPYNFTSDADATNLEIAAGLVADIMADSGREVDATDNSDGTYTLTAKVVDAPYTCVVDANQTIQTPFAASATIDTDIAKIFEENSEWYGLAETTHVKADVLLLAAWAEANKRLYITVSDEADIVDVSPSTDTTSLAAQVDAQDLTHTAVWYYHDLTKQPEAAWFGRALPALPGAINWAYLTLAGIEPTTLTSNQYDNLFAKRANAYSLISGANVTRFGTNGIDYIDITRAIDWLEARIKEEIFALLVIQDKVDYTDAGVASLESALRDVLNEGISNGAIAGDPAPTVTAPLVKDISTIDRSNRLLPDLDFTCTLTGAFNKVKVNGKVIV